MSGAHYKDMLRREVCRGESADDAMSVGSASSGGERKRRRRNRGPSEGAIDVDSRSSPSASDSNSTEDSDSDEFEDVEIDPQYPGDEAPITVTLGRGSASALEAAAAEARVRRSRPALVSKEERRQRVVVHQGCVATMAAHGAVRNQWCNDAAVQRAAVRLVPPEARHLLVRQPRNDDVLDVVRSRRWLDGLRRAMAAYGQRFRRTAPGLARVGWGEAAPRGASVTLERFRQLVAEGRGSRDVGAQGFVAALRGIGVEARLVYLLQPPDFTSTKAVAPTAAPTAVPTAAPEVPAVLPKAPSRSGGAGVQDSRRRMLGSLRSAAVAVAPARGRGPADAPFPVFWAEAWNRYSAKWVSIDPLTLRTLEVAPMRRRLAFEPPANEARVQLVYALAYDRWGGVCDVTRRYSHQYNAKTCRKRITRVDATWYERMLAAVAAPRRRVSRRDALELKEFHERDLAEGIPSNVGDFKNHPLYALELQLRQTEIIHPMDKTSQCGLFRAKGKRDAVVPIYKRLAVHQLRTARAWYMRGRVLKVGVAPLKVRAAAAAAAGASDGDGDDEVRLYADFQTTLYHPPPIVNGVIPKNAYGNVDIYVPSMVPANGHLIRTDGQYTMKMAEQAAKYILGIDYARAVVGFDFGTGVAGKKRSAPITREGGILIDAQFKEAMEAILDNLVEQEEERQRDLVERNSLQNWKYFLAKLRISKRLEVEHGAVEPEPESARDASDASDAYSIQSDTLGEIARGGFVVDDYREVEQHPGGFFDEGAGGFAPASPKGRFERADLAEKGGFVEDHHVEEALLDDDFLDEVPASYFHADDRGDLVYDPDVELSQGANDAPQMAANLSAKSIAAQQMAANSPKLESDASASSSQSAHGSAAGSLSDCEREAVCPAAPDDEFGFEYESD